MIDDLTIRVLVDNTATGPSLGGEHGLSLLLRWGDHVVLFDTGQTSLLLDNARALGEDLGAVELIVLSHGHYDHGGGLPDLLALRPELEVVAHPAVRTRRWSFKPGLSPRSIGLAESLLQGGVRFRFHEHPVEIAPGCTFLGAIERKHDEGSCVRHFFLDPEGTKPDRVPDDSGLVIDTRTGLVLITGCGHAGVANYLDGVRGRWPSRPIRMVLGGLHLQGASDEELESSIKALREAEVETVVPMHCTGPRGIEALAAANGFETRPLQTGDLLQL